MSTFSEHHFAPLALRVGAVALAAIAAWGPRFGGADGVERVVLLDVSASADSTGVTLSELVEGMGAGDAFRVLPFAASALPVAGSDAPGVPDAADTAVLDQARLAALDPHGSDLAAALRRVADLPRDRDRLEVWIVSDLRVTSAEGALDSALAALRDGGGAEFRVREVPSRPLEPRVASLTGPGRAARGEVVSLVADGDAGSGGGRLQLVDRGQVVDARDLPPGPFRVGFHVRPSAADLERGAILRSARFAGEPARPAPRAHVVLADPGVPLVLVRDAPAGPDADALSSRLASAFTTPVVVAGVASGEWARLLPAHDLTVLAGTSLSPRARMALGAWVAAGGGALLIGDVVWDDFSPLRTVPPDDPGRFLYLALDGSGSMGAPWSGGRGQTRDAVVRAALRELVAGAGADTTIALRRFNDRLLPVDRPAWTGRPGAQDMARFDEALEGLPVPAGGTRLVPVLVEAAALSAGRAERARRALVFSDGRLGDDAAELAVAARRLIETGCGLTVVIDDESARTALAEALSDTGAEIVLVTDSAGVAAALRDAADRARTSPGVLRDVSLRPGPDAALAAGAHFPAQAPVLLRRWASTDAAVLVETADAVPAVAIRRHGLGRVAALGVQVGNSWPGADEQRWLAELRGVVERASSREVRVSREGDRLLVRALGGARPASVESAPRTAGAAWASPLRPVGDGLLAADLPPAATETGPGDGLLVVLDEERRPLIRIGLDTPGAAELRAPRQVDMETLGALAAGAPRDGGRPLRPWLAAAAALLVLAAHWLAARQLSSRPLHLPM